VIHFSIITITYNSSRFLAETVDSVINQDFPDFEYIIVDGGSTDGTLDIVRKYAERDSRIRWVSEPDGGIADAMNKGVRLATGDIVAHLHSDDTYLPGALRQVADAFARHADARWLTGCLRHVNERGEFLYDSRFKDDYSLESLLRRNLIGHPATFIRREVFAEVGGFDAALRYAMDYDLWLRIAPRYPVLPLPSLLATFRVHAESLSSRELLQAFAEEYLIRQRFCAAHGRDVGFGDTVRYHKERLVIKLGLNNLRKRLFRKSRADRS
jgi:glycosyltransferase involved in cell wall biosynthesis